MYNDNDIALLLLFRKILNLDGHKLAERTRYAF